MTGDEVTDAELDELARLRAALAGHRWPWAPLEAAMGSPSWSELSSRLGVHESQISRWRREGLTDRMADRCALAIGTHPRLVWPGWDDVADTVELEGVA
jgi:hypothetical protein